jgi:hypothetical protein
MFSTAETSGAPRKIYSFVAIIYSSVAFIAFEKKMEYDKTIE